MYYAHLTQGTGLNMKSSLFPIVDYRDGFYMVEIDFVFPMKLKRIIWRQE